MTRFALRRVGEIGLDRPRLLDFITEQTIVVGLQSHDKRAVIEKLVRRLCATSEIGADIERLREDLLRQGEEDSFFVGPGLVITHAVIEGDGPVRGVLGLSSKGLKLAAPDRRRVHAVLLLAIPSTQEAHYLEIVAAFSAGIVSNPTTRYQLYHSPSAAHAHKVLNPRVDTDFNSFLDETLVASSPPPAP
jgi:mannitol/fructose-specific phosphotransferase system IIA component (Ntr-type)